MQRRQRRMSSRSRNPRAARNPAYQIKSRYQLAPESPADGDTESWDAVVEPSRSIADAEWRRPEQAEQDVVANDVTPDKDAPERIDEDTLDEASIDVETEAVPGAEDTSFQPEIETGEIAQDEQSGNETVPEGEHTDATDEPSTEVLPVVQPALQADPAEDFSTYVKKIEEAAARSRAQQRGAAMSAPRPVASAEHHPAAAPYRSSSQAQRRPRPDARSGGRGGRRGGPPPVQKPFFRRRRTWLFIVAFLILLPVLIGTLYAANVLRLGISAYQDIHTPPEDRVRYVVNPEGTPEPVSEEQAEAMQPNWGANDIVNIVLMGIDDRHIEDDFVRSDTIIVVNINPETGNVTMMSIPRDLRVFIPQFGHEKMNAAYAMGDANRDTVPGGGPTLVAQTIEANFGIPIHYYATIDFDGFEKIIDTVGGVIIDVQNQLSDNLYPTEDLRLTRIYFSTGLQTMDGTTALEYVRTRHADSDIARGQRQQQVLMAIRERAVVRDLITRAPEMIEDVGDTLRTDLDLNQMLALANLGRQIDPQNIARVDLWQEGILTEHFPEFEGDAYYLEANWVRVRQLQEEFFDAPLPVASAPSTSDSGDADSTSDTEDPAPTATPTETPTEPDMDTPIVVENGTDIPALAGQTTQFLVDYGFTAVWASDAEELTSTTLIFDGTGNRLTAELLADVLGLDDDAIVEIDGTGITVVIGDDFPAATQEQVEP